MEHKAFAFDWNAFQRHLAPILRDALSSDSVVGLAAFIEHHRQSLTDPYEGEPLPEDWSSLMENRDVQDHGDFALTTLLLADGRLWDRRFVGLRSQMVIHQHNRFSVNHLDPPTTPLILVGWVSFFSDTGRCL